MTREGIERGMFEAVRITQLFEASTPASSQYIRWFLNSLPITEDLHFLILEMLGIDELSVYGDDGNFWKLMNLQVTFVMIRIEFQRMNITILIYHMTMMIKIFY